MNATSISLTGTVIRPVVSGKKAKYLDIKSCVPRMDIVVRLRLPLDAGDEYPVGTRVIAINGQLYRSKDENSSDFALNLKHCGQLKKLDEEAKESTVETTSCSMIADVASNVKFGETNAEFMIHDETVDLSDINIHVVVTEANSANFPIKKGDKIMLFGCSVGKKAGDQNCSFLLFTDRRKVHLIPYFDGEKDASEI